MWLRRTLNGRGQTGVRLDEAITFEHLKGSRTMFTALSITFSIVGLVFLIGAVSSFLDRKNALTSFLVGGMVVFFIAGVWFQTHKIVSVNHVGISRSTFSQELRGPLQAGIVEKPFFGKVFEFPASTNYERCETYTPALKGSYGIALDACFYYNAGQVDWLKEIDRTGQLDAGNIMNVWRNSVVGDVAKSVKMYTPEALSEDRSVPEQAIFENVTPWFIERGVPLVSLSFKNWDFTSETVAAEFDQSIVSQRKIAEQAALFEAAKISREREEYEAETARLVSEKQKAALNLLGLEGDAAVDWMWVKYLTEKDEVPDVLILGRGGEAQVSIPFREVKPDDTD